MIEWPRACWRVIVIGLSASALIVSSAPAQTLFEADRVGTQHNRDYLNLQPFEQLDTQSGNIILTISDLTLPSNAGHDLKFEFTYNSNITSALTPWTFGIRGIPMRITQEQTWPVGPFANTVDETAGITPILQMADGGEHRTVFANAIPLWNNPPTMYEVSTSDYWRYHRDTHTLELADGTVCTYVHVDGDNAGTLRLALIADVFGNLVNLSWSENALEVAQTLIGEQPRHVHFDLNAATHLPTRMTFLSNDGSHDRVWQYDYEGGDTDTTGRLTQTASPNGLGWTFGYVSLGPPWFRLRSVTTPNGGTILYDFQVLPVAQTERVFLTAREMFDRGGASLGAWSIVCALASGYCTQTTITTPSARVVYAYGPVGVGHPSTLIDGGIGVTNITVQDPTGSTTFQTEERLYTEVSVVNSSYRAAKVSERSIHRSERTYRTTVTYGAYGLPTQIVEAGEITRTIDRTYSSKLNPLIIDLINMDKVTIGSQSLRHQCSTYDSQGFCTSATELGVSPYNLWMSFTRDAGGNVASITRRGTTTSFTYIGGRPATTATALTGVTRTINPDGTTASETVRGQTTTFDYDDAGRLTATHLPGENPVTVEYDNVGGSWVRTTQGTLSSTATLDGFSRTILTENSLGVKTRTEYDPEGRVIYQGYPFTGTADRGTRLQFDALGRLARTFPGDPNSGVFTSRDYFPGYVRLTDENDHQTVQTYQAFGDPDNARLSSVVDANQQPWTYEYDAAGALTRVISPDGLTRTWVYNNQHNLCSETHPESGATWYGYDSVGRLTQITDANTNPTPPSCGSVISMPTKQYTYDTANRIQTITTPERVTTFGYEPDSNLRQWVSSAPRDGSNQQINSTYSLYLYDAASRTTDRFDLIDGKTFSTGYDYDANGNVVGIRYPTLGAATNRREIGYQRDTANRITRVFDRRTSINYGTDFIYHPSGMVTSYTAGNGIATQVTVEPNRYWTQSITAGALQLQYGYDNVGNVTSIADGRGLGQAFTYDALDRLTRMDGSGGYPPAEFAYDVHGNPASIPNGTTYTYEPGKLRLASQGNITFTYDNNGNLRTAPNQTFQYTPENWLETVVAGGVVTVYAYDGDGWRIKKTSGNTVTYYLRGLGGELLTEWTNPGPSGGIRDYVYADGRLLSAVLTTSTVDTGDVVSPIAAAGASVSINLASVDQNGRLLFNATMGQTVTITLTTSVAMTCNWTFTVLGPDGRTLSNATPCSGTSVSLGPLVLPTTGTYVILIDPNGATLGTVSASIANVSSGAPSIADFTPTIGPAGTPVTITGANLQTVDGVWVNGRAAVVTAVLSNSVTILIPTLAGSGPIRIHTPGGTAVSGADFFIPPAGLTVADVNSTGRLPFATATVVTVTTANQVAIRTFDRTAGQRFSLDVTNRNMMLSAKIYGPDGTLVVSAPEVGVWAATGTAFLDVVSAPMSGTYTLVFDPYSTSTGSAQLMLYDVPLDVNGGTLPLTGAPVTFTITTPGQSAFFTFFGAAGQRFAIAFDNTQPFPFTFTYVTLRAPDGSAVRFDTMHWLNTAWEPVTLPLDGVYQLFVNPWRNYIGPATFTAYDVPSDFTQPISTDYSPLTIVTTTAFQNAYVTFSGTVGQRVLITFTNGTYGTVFGGSTALATVYNPDGTTLYNGTSAGVSAILDTKTLGQTGTYTIKFDPQGIRTGSVVVRVATVPDDLNIPITPGGASVNVTTAVGQDAYLVFLGTANQRISVRTTNGTYGTCSEAKLYLLQPDGSSLATSTCSAVSAFFDTKVLPATGTYTVKMDPVGAAVGSITVNVYDVPADPTVSLTIGGGAQSLTTTVPGQNAGATFTATAGQHVTVRITNNTLGQTWVRLYKPDGTQQTSVLSSGASFNTSSQTLGTTGTYTILIDPNATPNTGSIGVAVTSP